MKNLSQIKSGLMSGAEIVDAWRIYPRLFITWYAAIVTKMVFWYISVPIPTTEQTGMIAGIVALCVPLLNWYMQQGRNWDGLSKSR